MKRLSIAVDASGLSARQLDRLTNGEIDANNLYRWMKGNGQPQVDNLLKLCKHLRVSSDWLIGLIESDGPAPIPEPWDGVTERRKVANGAGSRHG